MREALDALLAGPTAAERKRGITTAIPDQAHLVSLNLKGRERVVALVNLAGVPRAQGRQGEQATLGMRVRVITQIARTLIGLSDVTSVEIRVDEESWDLWTMNGRIARTKTDYGRLRGWTRICWGAVRQNGNSISVAGSRPCPNCGLACRFCAPAADASAARASLRLIRTRGHVRAAPTPCGRTRSGEDGAYRRRPPLPASLRGSGAVRVEPARDLAETAALGVLAADALDDLRRHSGLPTGAPGGLRLRRGCCVRSAR